MYKKVNITENTLQVLSLFTNGFNSEYYIREVQRLLNISPRTAQLILEDLEKKGIVIAKTRGKIKNYKLSLNETTKKYLVFVEQYKTIAFLEKNLLVKEIVEKISPFIRGIGIIFGSYVKQIEKPESDLDLFIAGSYNQKEIEKISETYGLEISIKCYPLKTFEKKNNKDILIEEVLKNHVVFIKTEEFIDRVMKSG